MRFMPVAFCFLLLLSVAMSGCSQKQKPGLQGKLIGTWQMNEMDDLHVEMVGETMEDRADDQNATSETIDTQGEFVAANLTIEFTSDGQLKTSHIMMNKPYEKLGTWELSASNSDHGNSEHGEQTENRADAITILCNMPSGKTTTGITFVDDNTIRMIPPNFDVLGKQHTFKRVE